MKKIKQLILAFAVVAGATLFAAPVATVGAINVDPLDGVCSGSAASNSEVCDAKDDNAEDVVKTVVNVLLYIVGIIAVIMIIVGGIMYAVSGGDSGSVTKAKNTILYSVVGLVVAFLAYAIVNWVVTQFS